MQGLPLLQPPHANAVHVVPLFSVLYFTWAGIEMSPFIRVLTWVLLLGFSVPMLAYLETMPVGMKAYEPALVKLATQPREQLLVNRGFLTTLLGVLPGGLLIAALSVGHFILYALVVSVALMSGQYVVLGIQLVSLFYIGWIFVFFRVQSRKVPEPPLP